MQLKSVVLLVLALGCGLVAAIGVTQVISKDTESAASDGDEVSIFVAMQDIAPGELVTPQMVRLEAWPKAKVPEGTFQDIKDLEGCRARVEIYQGEPLCEKKLLGKGVAQQTPTDYIPKGYRVVGVKVDLVSGAGMIRPGDRVDVLVHLKKNRENDVQESRTQTILQDIKVFAVDDVFKLRSGTDEDDTLQAKTISLLVTPDQAEKLMLAVQLGTVQLVMRSPADSNVAPTAGITPSELLGSTDSADRKAEEQAGLPSAAKASSGGLFDLLRQMQAKAEPKPTEQQPAPPAEPDRWNVRLLQGPEVNDVTLQQETGTSGVMIWRSDSYGQTATPNVFQAGTGHREPAAPTPPEPPTPPKAGQPKADPNAK